MYNVSDIKNYIIYLKKECGLSVTLHTFGNDNIVMDSELISFNIHDNSYCIYVKTCEDAHKHCIERQLRIRERCSDGSFSGVCYAGIREFVYPIKHYDEIIGFISVSGYKTDNYREYIRAVSLKYELSEQKLISTYRSLADDLPSKERIDTLIMPLCAMLELAYIKTENSKQTAISFCDDVIRYLKKNHTRKITSSDICGHFSCSRSHLSHSFNSHTGMSIRSYINMLRVNDAKALLENSELSITDIAFSVGFDDSNYFTDVFKKSTGMSPSCYRKQNRHPSQ